jgi:hypothetical protein
MSRLRAAVLPAAVWLAAALALAGPAGAQHEHHAAAPAVEGDAGFRVVRVINSLPGFKGGMTFDADSGRLFALSYGPPANIKGPSILYELEPASGRVLRQAVMPFEGELPSPVYLDGVLYQGVLQESRIYRVDARPGPGFGAVLGTVALPTLNDLGDLGEGEVFRFPFVAFHGTARTPGGRLLLHAQELGNLVEVDPATGRFTRRIPTLKGLASLAAVPGGPLLLAGSDPAQAEFESEVRRFMFRAAHTGPPLSRRGYRDVLWLLLDAGTGDVLASHESLESRAEAGAVALLRREAVPGTPYGRLTFLAAGEEGLIEIEWTPERGGGA